MKLHNVTNAKSVSSFIGNKRIALCMRDDVEIPLKPRKNYKRKPLPVPVKVMWNNIITAKGRYDES